MKIKGWLSSKRLLIAQCEKAQRQLQEAWEERDGWKAACYSWKDTANSITAQLHRLARERDEERRLRLAAEELREHYLEQLENEEE